jgi:hypothetical protein
VVDDRDDAPTAIRFTGLSRAEVLAKAEEFLNCVIEASLERRDEDRVAIEVDLNAAIADGEWEQTLADDHARLLRWKRDLVDVLRDEFGR